MQVSASFEKDILVVMLERCLVKNSFSGVSIPCSVHSSCLVYR